MDENLQQQPKKDYLEIDKEEMELDEEAKYEGLDLGLKDLEQEKQKLLLKANKIIIEELKEVEENKLRIDKEIEGLEARIAEERECLEYEEWDVVEKRLSQLKKNWQKWKNYRNLQKRGCWK